MANTMQVSLKLERRQTERLLNHLRTMGPKIERKVVRKALSKAGTVVARAVRKLVPKGKGQTSDGRQRQHLKQVIKKSLVRANRRGFASIRIGPEAKKAPHAHLVEFGTKERQRKRLGGYYRNVQNPTADQLRTGRAPEQSFLRKGFKQSRGQANRIIVTELRAGIAREARA